MTIFEWVRYRLSKIYSISEGATKPTQMLLEIGAPKDFYNIFESLEDIEYPLKDAFDGKVPDLEARSRSSKRVKGQFYTPESLAEKMVAMAYAADKLSKEDKYILDPACGDGSFLLAASKYHSLDNIYGYDIDPYALLVCFVRIVTVYPGKGWPKLEMRDFLLQRPLKKFSIIVGNPPYKVNLDEAYKSKLHHIYSTTEGELDLYTFFFEASISCLKNDGVLSMVTSHTWLVNHQCKKIREFIFNKEVSSISMLPPRFFNFAPGVLGVVTTVKNKDATKDYSVDIFTDYSEKNGWATEFKTTSDKLKQGIGLRDAMIPDDLSRIFSDMEASGIFLGDTCKIGVGIQESANKSGASSKFVFDEPKDESFKPVLRGREIEAFKVNWEKKYIQFGPHLAYAGDEKTYRNQKILYQNIRNEKLKTRLVATLDNNGFYFKNSLSFIVSKDKRYSMEFLTGLLNSTFVNAWFAGKNHSFHVTVTQVRQIPLPEYNKSKFQRVEKLTVALLNNDKNSKEWQTNFNKLDIAVLECYLGKLSEPKQILSDLDSFMTRAAAL